MNTFLSVLAGFFGEMAVQFINIGLLLTLTFGVLILLRPVTNRLLRPKYRMGLWFAGWFSGYLYAWSNLFGSIRLLPVTFRTLVTPRMPKGDLYPMYLPEELGRTGGEFLSLPGGGQIPLDLPQNTLEILGVVCFAAMFLLLAWDSWERRRLRAVGQRGEKMDREQMAQYGLTRDNVVVRLCRDLPTSFVRSGHDTGSGDGVRYVIYLQRELTEDQMRLVLLHEEEHIRQQHVWLKTVMTAELVLFYWWNPVIWLAFRMTCRDMELACDEAVLTKLDAKERQSYARTLVDLGSGRHMWASTSFGECDAVLRVKNAANWKPQEGMKTVLSWTLALLMVLFFFCGAPKPVHLNAAEDWNAYLYSGQAEREIQEKMRIPDWTARQIWEREDEELWLQGGNGIWYHAKFQWDYDREDYYAKTIQSARQPDLTGFTRMPAP